MAIGLTLGLLIGAYVAWLVVLYTSQDKMVFPADAAGRPQFAPFRTDIEPLDRPLSDQPDGRDGVVESWIIPASGASADAPAPAVIYFHGNAELIDYQEDLAEMYHGMGVTLMLIEYRGYGRSAGKATQDTVTDDALWFYDRLVERDDIDPSRIAIHGRSIGGSVAAQLAARRPVIGLILETSSPSIASMAKRYGAPPWMMRHPFRTDVMLKTFDKPVLVFGANQDQVFGVEDSHALAGMAKDAKLVTYEATHVSFPGASAAEYAAEIDAFLRRCRGAD